MINVSIVLPATTESILLLAVSCGFSKRLTDLINPGALVASKPNVLFYYLPMSPLLKALLSVPAQNVLTGLSGSFLPGQVADLTCPAGLLWVGLLCLVFYCPESATCVAEQVFTMSKGHF